MKLIKSLIACFSTYSKIKMPTVDLDSDDMKYVFVFFPLVGLVIGLIELLVFFGCEHFGFHTILRTALMVAVPIIVTGGIHVDGFMDVSDAINSYGDREKKLSIMKDPHTGAFAVISLATFGMLYFGFAYEINERSIVPFCATFVISRIMSAISVVRIKSAKSTGMISSVKEKTSDREVFFSLIIMLIIVYVLLILFIPIFGIISCVVSIAGYYIYKRKCIKEFDGITGDTSGYYLCMMELVLLIVAALEGVL